MVSLYSGPGHASRNENANYELLRKFLCRICSLLAIEPHKCACGAFVCRACCKKHKVWNSDGKKVSVIVPEEHLEFGLDWDKRAMCKGPCKPINGEDERDW